MAAGGTVNVLLKKCLVPVAPERVILAQFCAECRLIGILLDDGTLILWNIGEKSQKNFTNVKTFGWCTCNHISEPEESITRGDSLVTIKDDNSIELHCIIAEQSELDTECQAILTADLLKGLLRDRGKDIHVDEIAVIDISKQSHGCNALHTMTLLLNQMFVLILSVCKVEPPEVVAYFVVDFPTAVVPLLVPFSSIVKVKRCCNLAFSLFSSGTVLIHHVQGNLVGWVDIWSLYCCSHTSSEFIDMQEGDQYGITFTHLEVTEDLSLLLSADTSSNLYIIYLDDYFEQFPQHLNGRVKRQTSMRRRNVRFEYDAADEDAVARDPNIGSILYGDRVWKTELVGLKRSAHRGDFSKSVSSAHGCKTSERGVHWFNDIADLGIIRQKGVVAGCHHVFQTGSGGNLTGFRKAKDDRTTSNVVEFPMNRSGLVVVRSQTWMKTLELRDLVTSSDSILLSFRPNREMSTSDFPCGALCLYSFSTGEFSVHGMSEPTVIVHSRESAHSWYLLTKATLSIAAFDVTQDQLVHKVIMYENAALAESLCRLNQWDHCTIPIRALEVALQLRQLDTVAFFLKNQQNAFTRSNSSSSESVVGALSSSSPLSPPTLPRQVSMATTDIQAVIESLAKAVKYNTRQQHNLRFTQQLVQMILTYLHGLMEDGARLLELQEMTVKSKTEGEAPQFVPVTWMSGPDVEASLKYISACIVELRKHLNVVSLDNDDKMDATDGGMKAFVGAETAEIHDSMRDKWETMGVKEFVEDAVTSGNLCAAQAILLSDKNLQQDSHPFDKCDGSLSNLNEIGLKGVLEKLVKQDTDAAVKMLTNLGRSVVEELHRICFHTLHRSLRDFLCKELADRGNLTEEDKETIEFVHTAEALYEQQSFELAKRNLNASTQRWTDMGLLGNSFNLSSTQVLETYIHTGNLLSNQPYEQNSSGYAELLLDWASSWDKNTRERILAERMLANKDQEHSAVQVGAEAVWLYLCSQSDWRTLRGWIRAMAPYLDASRDDPALYVGERFAIKDGALILPPLSRDVYNQLTACPRFVKELVLDELTRNGMFTAAQLCDFPLLLHHLSKTQTLFGPSHPLSVLKRETGAQSADSPVHMSANASVEDDNDEMKDSCNTSRCIVSVTDFHQQFIEYCIQMELVGLLYYYMAFYRLGETEENLEELKLDSNCPSWLRVLVRFRMAGLYCPDPSSVFQASLANSRLIMKTSTPSVTEMLQAGHPVMAMATLLYGPGPVSQAIVPFGCVPENPRWQVDEGLLHRSLAAHPKLHSALFPGTSFVDGIELQDISVYRLLQGNCPFEISRIFGWQETNELALKNVGVLEMPHFSLGPLVSQYAHSEQLSFSYFLRHGRPSFAFTTFVADQLKEKTIFKTRIQHAALKAYRVAVKNFTSSQISSACVVFTEMLGVDSTSLRVDLEAANRVVLHGGKEGALGSELQNGETIQDAIAFELLSCAGRASRQPERLLKALQEATRNLISKDCLDRTSFEAGQRWNLVILFCRVHKLELCTAYLQDCARADKWLALLYHAQTYPFPPHQVLDVINHSMCNSHIKEHLILALENVVVIKMEQEPEDKDGSKRRRKRKPVRQEQAVTSTRDVRAQFYARMGLVHSSQSEMSPHLVQSSSAEDEEAAKGKFKKDSDKSSGSTSEGKGKMNEMERKDSTELQQKPLDPNELPDNLFDVLFRCQSAMVPWRTLLAHAIALHRALLAVLAACYEDAKPLDCICVWLCSTLPPQVLEPATAQILGLSSENQYDMSALQWHRWRSDDLLILLKVIVSAKGKFAHSLTKGFYIFDPENPLVHFLRFHESFVVHLDYEACLEQLSLFKREFKKMSLKGIGGKGMCTGKMDELEWLENLTNQITQQMLAQCDSSYEQHHLISLLAKTMFGQTFRHDVQNYRKLHEVAKVVGGAGVEIRLSLLMKEGSDEAKAERDGVMEILLQAHHFRQARKFAALLGLPDDHITLKEVLSERDSIQNSKLWDVKQGRLAFWLKTDKCFLENCVNPSVAASFFENESESEALPFIERANLLSLALKWTSVNQGDPVASDTDLIQLQRKMWLFRIRAEMANEREARFSRSISHLEFLPEDISFDFPVNDRSTGHSWSFRTDLADELVQEKSLEIDDALVSSLETEEERLALESVSGDLLDGCLVTQARWLAALFGHSSQDLNIVMSCIHLAQGKRYPSSLDEPVRRLLTSQNQRRLSRSSSVGSQGRRSSFILNSTFTDVALGDTHTSTGTDWAQVEETITTMESLSFHCNQGKKCCACVVTCYKIAQTLGLDYNSVVKKRPFELLHAILISGFDNRYKLVETYIKSFHLDTAQVTKFLADTVLHSLRLYSTGQVLPSNSEYADLVVNAAPSRDDISQMIKLCPDQSSLGKRLLEAAASSASERLASTTTTINAALSLEVELLVRAHECHTLACNMEGIASVLHRGKLITAALAKADEYRLMVRLLIGVGRFHDMSYIFDTLLENHQFELLCRREVDKEENKLKVALLDYLKRYHPTDTEKYSIVACHFSMHREIAETLEESATVQLKLLKENMTGPNHPELQSKLSNIMRSFCYAADRYSKEGCMRHSQTCLKQARLVKLQVQLLPAGVTVVNLEEHGLSKFLATHCHFFEALLVADAYKKRGSTTWVDAVYAQVVLGGDFKYLQDLRSAVSLSSVFFVDVVTKYKQESPRSSQAASNLRRLLGYLSEVRIRYKLAIDLNFRDVASAILDDRDSGAYLRDVMAP